MKRRQSTMQWLEANRDIWWDLLRIYLGFALVVKGIVYMTHRTPFAAQMSAANVPFASTGLAEVVALTHIAGGLMLAFGLLTRIGAAIQIPNLLGAVFFVHLKEGLFTPGQTLEFAMLVLFVLGLYAFSGAGRLSIDYAFSNKREEALELERASMAPPRTEPREPAHAQI
jgi:putative oxidoreductase